MLTSDQVAAAVGTSGPYTGAHEDPADDGSPVWGCTWGTHASFADIRETTAERFTMGSTADITTTPISGVGDQAHLDTNKSDGGTPRLWFAAGSRYYVMEVDVSRRELGAENADREKAAEQTLAKALAAKLSG